MDKKFGDFVCKCDYCLREILITSPTFEADCRKRFQELKEEVLSIFPDANMGSIHNGELFFNFSNCFDCYIFGSYYFDKRYWVVEICFNEDSNIIQSGLEGEALLPIVERCYVKMIEKIDELLEDLKNSLKNIQRREKGKNENV